MTFYENIMGYIPENIWTAEMCTVLAACLYWNGFPQNWVMSDLWDIDKFPTHLIKKEQLKEWARRNRVLDMTFEIVSKIKKGRMKGTFRDENNGPYFVSPQEFFRYVYSRGYDAHDSDKVRRDLSFAPSHIQSAISEMKKRKTPELASDDVIFKKRRLPACQCGGRYPCCSYRVLQSVSLLSLQAQIKKYAIRFNMECICKKGQKAKPLEVFKSSDCQRYFKKIKELFKTEKSPEKHETLIKKYRSLILKNWIPQAIGTKTARRISK